MPISQPSYQLKLELDLPDDDPTTLSTDDARIRAEAARAALEGGNVWPKGSVPEWYEQYIRLIYGKWPWRVAVLIAWLAVPKNRRWPKTQDELAVQVMGLTSARQFSVWMSKNPAILAQVHDLQMALVWEDLGEVLSAGLQVAKKPDYKSKGDREMIYKMAGLLSDKEIEILNKSGAVNLSALSWDEKLRLAGLDNPDALIALKAKLAAAQRQSDEEDDESSDAS